MANNALVTAGNDWMIAGIAEHLVAATVVSSP